MSKWTLARQTFAVCSANSVYFLWGIGVGFTSPCLPKLKGEQIIQEWQGSWIASALVAGQILGSLLGPPMADLVGRRIAFIVDSLTSIAGWFLIILAPGQSDPYWYLLGGRLTHGLGEAMGSAVALFFVSEIATEKKRGILVNSSTVASGSGIVAAYALGSLLPWRMLAVYATIHHLGVALAFTAIIPDTPQQLERLRKEGKAKQALKWFGLDEERRGKDEDEDLLRNKEVQDPKAGSVLKPALIVLTLFLLFPLSGIYSVTFYAVDLFHDMGVGSRDAVAISAASVRVLGTTTSTILIGRLGRRKIQLWSSVLVFLCLVVAGVCINAGEGEAVVVLAIMVYMFSMGLGVMAIPYVLLGEWFSVEVKSALTSIILAIFNVVVFVSVKTTPMLEGSIGLGMLFFLFAAFSFMNVMLSMTFLKETDGKHYYDSTSQNKTQYASYIEQKT